ncbi:MAG TPA: GDSL-type esterase/lipase family protein [Acidimicrobiales bacterium]
MCLGALVTAAPSCEGTISPPGPVLLVGDSIFFMATDELTYTLRAEGWDVTVDAVSGSGIRNGGFEYVSWPDRLRDLVDVVDPEVVVVELGTNGCGNCDSIPEAIEADMAELRGVELVLWLDVATFGPRAEKGGAVNAALEDAAERWDNLEILPYDDWFAGRTDLIPADDVHPTPAGERALARHVADALADRTAATGDDAGSKALGALVVVIAAVVLFRGKG